MIVLLVIRSIGYIYETQHHNLDKGFSGFRIFFLVSLNERRLRDAEKEASSYVRGPSLV